MRAGRVADVDRALRHGAERQESANGWVPGWLSCATVPRFSGQDVTPYCRYNFTHQILLSWKPRRFSGSGGTSAAQGGVTERRMTPWGSSAVDTGVRMWYALLMSDTAST